VPEGDTIFRVAAGLRPHLVGRPVLHARASGGARVEQIVGATIEAIETHGKNLLIHLSSGLSVRTHLRMTGTWHRYRPGEGWLRPASRAALVLEVEDCVAVCFDAPIVELFETRSRALHPVLSRLGPDFLAEGFDPAAAVARLRESSATATAIGEALLDQRVVAGVGNVYRSEVLFIERVDPFAVASALDDATLGRIVGTARRHLLLNAWGSGARATTARAAEGAGTRLWVYRRGGRPCRRCGTLIRSASLGADLPRTVWWCPRCQASTANSIDSARHGPG
jgi:endonuclease VIII